MPHLSKPVQGVFFDLGWTLLTPVTGDWMFSSLARQYFPLEKMAELPAQRVEAALSEAQGYLNQNHRLHTMEEEYGQFLHYYSLLAEALPELQLTKGDLEQVAWDKVYEKRKNYAVFPDAKSTLERLQGKYRLGVISDTWPSIRPVMEEFGLLSYFDCFTFSFEVGCFKPDRRMYQDALEKMGLAPEACVFVDDGVKNLQGAQAAGIQPVLITAKPGAEECPHGMASVQTVSGILKLLEET